MVSAQQIQATMARYVELVDAGDIDGIVALYGQDAVVEDPAHPFKSKHTSKLAPGGVPTMTPAH
jgi:ketosteroid isomerase-like protein